MAFEASPGFLAAAFYLNGFLPHFVLQAQIIRAIMAIARIDTLIKFATIIPSTDESSSSAESEDALSFGYAGLLMHSSTEKH